MILPLFLNTTVTTTKADDVSLFSVAQRCRLFRKCYLFVTRVVFVLKPFRHFLYSYRQLTYQQDRLQIKFCKNKLQRFDTLSPFWKRMAGMVWNWQGIQSFRRWTKSADLVVAFRQENSAVNLLFLKAFFAENKSSLKSAGSKVK